MNLSMAFYVDSVPFTKDVIEGRTSLGGSESACLGTAKALARLGHDVHVFATKLEDPGVYDNVAWHQAEEEMLEVLKFAGFDMFCSLRMPGVFQTRVPTPYNVLWNQDLLIQPSETVDGAFVQLDEIFYVSRYHRKQWEGRSAMAKRMPSWITKNGIDLNLVRADAGNGDVGHRFIHTSRPERGYDALIKMWPAIRARFPDAVLRLCRYSSMYDAGGWGRVVKDYDQRMDRLNQEVGGIESIGNELDKEALYREMADASLVLYPTSQKGFAETNCIAATEAQACGTPMIGSRIGALPETLAMGAGILIDGDWQSDKYQEMFLDAIAYYDDQGSYDTSRQIGFEQAEKCDFNQVAVEWNAHIHSFFDTRYKSNKVAVLRNLLHNDEHAVGLVVAKDITKGPDVEEAVAAQTLCERVVRQEEQTAEHYGKFAIQDTLREVDQNNRLQAIASRVAEWAKEQGIDAPKVLDLSCGNGSASILFSRAMVTCTVDGFDYSPDVLELARGAAKQEGVSDRVQFGEATYDNGADVWDVDDSRFFKGYGEYDIVFCGEFLEHVEHPWATLDTLESYARDGGLVILTTPCGPFAELLQPGVPRQRGHVHSFSLRDVLGMMSTKDSRWHQFMDIGRTPRGTSVGYWLFSFEARADSENAPALDYWQRAHTTRPYQRIVASMIMRNGSEWLAKCLHSIYGIVDKVVILDTGSDDNSQTIAEAMGAEVHQGEELTHFGNSRNQALRLVEDEAEWILWMDVDEHLDQGHNLRQYTTGTGPFNAYALRQHHLMVDSPNFYDKPCRVFRANRGVRFYGYVHEQPEDTPDKGIMPAMELGDVGFIHLGYHRNDVRRSKMQNRNLPLLKAEVQSPNPRVLSYVLLLRDYVNFATFEIEISRGQINSRSRKMLMIAIKIYQDHNFNDPDNHFHNIAFPFYQTALELLKGYLPVIHTAWAFASQQGTLEGLPRPEKFYSIDADEAEILVRHKLDAWLKIMRPVDTDTSPWKPNNGTIDVEPAVKVGPAWPLVRA